MERNKYHHHMVEMLFVLPSEQGKGYGYALLNYAFEEKHIRKIDVNEQNTEAYQFYLNQGYHAIARDEMDATTYYLCLSGAH